MKIKLAGDDLEWDVARVAAIEQVNLEIQHRRGCEKWWYSTDFNEKCPNVQYLLDFLHPSKEKIHVLGGFLPGLERLMCGPIASSLKRGFDYDANFVPAYPG